MNQKWKKTKKEAKIFQPSSQYCIEVSDVSCVLSQLDDIDIFAQRPKLPISWRPQPVIARRERRENSNVLCVNVGGEFI